MTEQFARYLIVCSQSDKIYRGSAAGTTLMTLSYETDIHRARRVAAETALTRKQRCWVLVEDGAADLTNNDVPPPNYTVFK